MFVFLLFSLEKNRKISYDEFKEMITPKQGQETETWPPSVHLSCSYVISAWMMQYLRTYDKWISLDLRFSDFWWKKRWMSDRDMPDKTKFIWRGISVYCPGKGEEKLRYFISKDDFENYYLVHVSNCFILWLHSRKCNEGSFWIEF